MESVSYCQDTIKTTPQSSGLHRFYKGPLVAPKSTFVYCIMRNNLSYGSRKKPLPYPDVEDATLPNSPYIGSGTAATE